MKAAARRATATPEARVRSFIDKFDPADRMLIRAVRRALRRRFATAYELAYDNYNIRVPDVAVLSRPEVEALMSAAVAQSKARFRTAGRPVLIVRSVSA